MKKREHVEEIKNRYEAAKLERRAKKGMDQFPDDKADEARRLRIIMEQMRKKGLLDQEEEEKVFGPGGYLEQAEQRAANSPKVVVIKEKTEKKSVWHRAAKWASVAAIFCVSIVVLTMSSEANREYVKDTVQYYVGDDVVVKSSGGKDNVIRGVSEVEMRKNIKENLNIDVPIFHYQPEEMALDGYEIYNEDGIVFIYYTVERKKITLRISNSGSKNSNTKTYDGKMIDTIWGNYNKVSIDIFENFDENGYFKTYSAKWEKDKNSYILMGGTQKEEFYKILKKMAF